MQNIFITPLCLDVDINEVKTNMQKFTLTILATVLIVATIIAAAIPLIAAQAATPNPNSNAPTCIAHNTGANAPPCWSDSVKNAGCIDGCCPESSCDMQGLCR
jgi:hypothetical protein